MRHGEEIHGYEASIHRAIWERVTTMGAPRLWGSVWLVSCLYAGLVILTVVGFTWLLLPGVIWALGQGTLIALTSWDSHWDEVAIAQIARRYRSSYEAG